MSSRILAVIAISLSAGNFAYQAFTSAQWVIAIDRSYWQICAVFTVGVVQMAIEGRK